MAITFKAIATITTASGSITAIDFTNIPATYTDLLLLGSSRHIEVGGSAWATLRMTFNNNTSNSYNDLVLGTNGSSIAAFPENGAEIYLRDNNSSTYSTANTFGNLSIYIPNYTGSNPKVVSMDYVSENNATAAWIAIAAGKTTNTAAITQITLKGYYNGDTFDQYTKYTLYGISNA